MHRATTALGRGCDPGHTRTVVCRVARRYSTEVVWARKTCSCNRETVAVSSVELIGQIIELDAHCFAIQQLLQGEQSFKDAQGTYLHAGLHGLTRIPELLNSEFLGLLKRHHIKDVRRVSCNQIAYGEKFI